MATKGTKRSRIKKGDQVVVIAGRDNGKRGRVLDVLPTKGRIKVEGVAVVKRHTRPDPRKGSGGGIVDKEAYISISNVQLVDPQTGKPTRVKYQVADDGSKARIAAKTGNTLDR